MSKPQRSSYAPDAGHELTAAFRSCTNAIVGIAVFSGIVNLLALTGAIYMLQVYDRVLASNSLETLVGLTALMIGLYLLYGILDMLRSRLLSQIGMRFDRSVRERVFTCMLRRPLRTRLEGDTMQPVRDLDQVRAFLSGPGPVALFDAPWLPLFLGLVYLLHPWLGLFATAGAVVLIVLTFATEALSRGPGRDVSQTTRERELYGRSVSRNAEVIKAHGIADRVSDQWSGLSEQLAVRTLDAQRVIGSLGAISRSFRLILQSAILGVGALLVIDGVASAGVMIAASILAARALAPLEIAISNWRGFVAARLGYARLREALAELPSELERVSPPRPTKTVRVSQLTVGAPGTDEPIIREIDFELSAGDGVGVIGAAASGKTTLARALVGVWQPLSGGVEFDGNPIEAWRDEDLGRDIGYLPQNVELLDATIAENIARHAETIDSEAVIAAAKAARVHELILLLPDGYDTRIGNGGEALSAGQRQRIGLARALYADPFLVVLDEPNSNLDAEGDVALAAAIAAVRQRGGIVVAIAHRASVLSPLNKLLVMQKGQLQHFGAKDDILTRLTQQAAPNGQRPDKRNGPAPDAGPGPGE